MSRLLDGIGAVASFEPSCVVQPDDSQVVRGARPITEADRAAIREQQITALLRAWKAAKA